MTQNRRATHDMKTAIVILNWNTEGFLREFLPGLVRSVGKVEGAEVVVADNASSDGSMEVVRRGFPDVRTIVFDENLGFTGGYNEAFRRLVSGAGIPHQGRDDGEMEPEYFVLINSDIEVTENWLEPLVEWMDTHPECGVCAPKLHSWQEREKFEYAGAAGGYIDMFGYPFCRGRVMKRVEIDRGQYDSPADVFWATGACLMVRSRIFHELKGLDSRFFAHMEEIDLCWRMQLHGYKVTVVPESVVYHVGGGTLPATSPFKLRLNFRNNLLMLGNNLAMTLALKMYKEAEGKGIPGQAREDMAMEAAEKGCREASRIIFWRKCLDGLSAAVYLLTGRFRFFKAVLDAHKEYRRLSGGGKSPAEIAGYLEAYGSKASVKGIYSKWIILESILHGEKIFGSIEERNFYKIGKP